MEEDVQHDKATQLFGIPPTGTRGAASSQLANVNKLTNFALAHKQGADHNPVLVDHIDSYFILTPVNIFDLADGRRITQLRFLEFLLYQAEMKRRQQVREEKESEYEVRLQSEVIAHRVRMDGLLASRRRTLLRSALNDLYSFGVKVGFLESFQVDQKGTKGRMVDVWKLNKAKFEEFKSPQSLVPLGAKSTSSTSKV